MNWKIIMFIGLGIAFLGMVIGGIYMYKEEITIKDLFAERLPAIISQVRQLGSVDIDPTPLNDSSTAEGGYFNYDCLLNFGGGSGSGTTGNGNWTYCVGAGCTNFILLTSGTTDLTGVDADGNMPGCSGNDCGNLQQATNVTTNDAGVYWLVCNGWDQDGPDGEMFTSPAFKITVTGEPADTCTYTSGTWEVDCSDTCVISDPIDLGGDDIIISGTGTFTMTADVSNYGLSVIEGTDSSNRCIVTCDGGCLKN